MTEKLYYKDAYISNFDATVRSASSYGEGYRVTLDKTAFFPNEGGQSADRGYIGDARVIDVAEIDGEIYHLTDKAVPIGATLACAINFEERFEKMQLHTAEHIVCGIIHSRYGYENVGFHLGEDVVTFDISSVMTREMLDEVEDEANLAVFKNIPVVASFPTSEELAKRKYRSKLDITEGVRLVEIDGVDSCACCAPHVAATGEIGIIKLLDFEKHRGGVRIYLTAGKRALLDYRRRYELTKTVSGYLSKPQYVIDEAVCELLSERDELRRRLLLSQISRLKLLADSEPSVDGCRVFDVPDADITALREFCNIMSAKSDGYIVAVSQSDGAYRYVISKREGEVSDFVKAANAALSGKGGGRGPMATGNFSAAIEDIKTYFDNL